jgi:inhibitor of KinA
MNVLPLGDQAALVYCSDEASALELTQSLRTAGHSWLVDVVQAYASVGIFFDPDQIQFARLDTYVRRSAAQKPQTQSPVAERRFLIPCCYEYQLDLTRVAEHTSLSADQIVTVHTSIEYTVYAIGFCPGFPYLGYLPTALAGVPRLPSPRVQVAAGSVGLTGRQTGIYTESRPGGWNLIGRTPLELVNVDDGYFPLQTGDRVQFIRIDVAEYQQLQGERL